MRPCSRGSSARSPAYISPTCAGQVVAALPDGRIVACLLLPQGRVCCHCERRRAAVTGRGGGRAGPTWSTATTGPRHPSRGPSWTAPAPSSPCTPSPALPTSTLPEPCARPAFPESISTVCTCPCPVCLAQPATGSWDSGFCRQKNRAGTHTLHAVGSRVSGAGRCAWVV